MRWPQRRPRCWTRIGTPSSAATVPNAAVYPHRWLWDSCFHVIAWAALGRPEAEIELQSLMASRLPTVIGRGFVPHMVYADEWRNGGGIDRGVLRGMSSFTQPPVYAMALTAVLAAGSEPAPVACAGRGGGVGVAVGSPTPRRTADHRPPLGVRSRHRPPL